MRKTLGVVGGRTTGAWSLGIGCWSSLGEGKEMAGCSCWSARRESRRGSVAVGGGVTVGMAVKGRWGFPHVEPPRRAHGCGGLDVRARGTYGGDQERGKGEERGKMRMTGGVILSLGERGKRVRWGGWAGLWCSAGLT
jgi:hypothetical protein